MSVFAPLVRLDGGVSYVAVDNHVLLTTCVSCLRATYDTGTCIVGLLHATVTASRSLKLRLFAFFEIRHKLLTGAVNVKMGIDLIMTVVV